MLIGEIDGIHFKPLERCLGDLLDVLGRLFVRHCSLRTAEGTDVFPGVFTPLTRAGRSRLRCRSKGPTAPGMLLQYPTPRFPRG